MTMQGFCIFVLILQNNKSERPYEGLFFNPSIGTWNGF